MERKKYDQIQKEELKTWNIEDPVIRRDKLIRETIRYPLIKRQLGLDHLDTSWMEVWDIGCGATGGVTRILNAKKKVYIDPLAESYGEYYDVTNFRQAEAEELEEELATPDLIIVTNALDHFKEPDKFLDDIRTHMKAGAFFAHLHASNNAISHPHPAHVHNVTEELVDDYMRGDFEKVWYLNNREHGLTYGWRKQKAFSGLYRRVTGYDNAT